ncbi:hypothetical protein U0070_005866, partial [Myodes glareolus]
ILSACDPRAPRATWSRGQPESTPKLPRGGGLLRPFGVLRGLGGALARSDPHAFGSTRLPAAPRTLNFIQRPGRAAHEVANGLVDDLRATSSLSAPFPHSSNHLLRTRSDSEDQPQ